MIHFDTLQYTKTLRAAGIPEEHAEAMAEAQKATLAKCLDTTLVTKADMAATKADIQEVRAATKADIQEVRTELKADIQDVRTELKADIQEVRDELKADIQEVRTELKADIQEVRIELVAIEHRLESKATKEDVQNVRSELAVVASNVKVLAWMMSVLFACMGSLMTKAFL